MTEMADGRDGRWQRIADGRGWQMAEDGRRSRWQMADVAENFTWSHFPFSHPLSYRLSSG